MIIAALVVLGLCLGSFVNALVWRLHEQAKKGTGKDKKLSIVKGRSMCPHCSHELAAKDLLPLVSWLSLRGRCRYCGKPVSKQYPLVELATALLVVASYVWWPEDVKGLQTAIFLLWAAVLTGLLALLIYDAKWYLLPDRIIVPLAVLASLFAVLNVFSSDEVLGGFVNVILAVAVGGGLFYLLFQVSKGKWIGGGDVKLGWLLGLVVGTPGRSLLLIFIASLLGTAVALPLLLSHKVKRTSVVPFGPFLIAAAILVQFFGQDILHWYQQAFFPYTF